MFSKAKSKEKKNRNHDQDGDMKTKLAQFGLLDVGDMSGINDNDEDLEAELLALTGGKKRDKKAENIVPEELDKMVADCMREDVDKNLPDEDDPELLAELNALGPGSSEDEEEDQSFQDESSSITGSGSETVSISSPNDTQPSNNLSSGRPLPTIAYPKPMMAGNSVLSLLNDRIIMYQEAERNSIAVGDTTRARRITRGLKTLNQMLKTCKAGKAINEEDIPPIVITKFAQSTSTQDLSQIKSAVPEPSATIPQTIAFSQNTAAITTISSQQYPSLTSPTNQPFSQPMPSVWDGPLPSISSEPLIAEPTNFVPDTCPTNSSLIFSQSLTKVTNLQNEYKLAALDAKKSGDKDGAIQCLRIFKQLGPMVEAVKNGQEIDINSLPPSPKVHLQAISCKNVELAPVPSNDVKQPVLKEQETLVRGPDIPINTDPSPNPPAACAPTSIIEALEERLAKYTQQRDKSKEEDNSRKERMNQRIMKQYQDAIKSHKAGKVVQFDELPTPPGFGPIPVPVETSSVPVSQSVTVAPPTTQTGIDQPVDNGAAQKPRRMAPAIPQNVRMAPKSRVERQLSMLEKRQNLFKEAALEAKKKGEIEQAKEYLRNYKGFDQLILATNSGLPVDMNTVPVPPQDHSLTKENSNSLDFEIVDQDDCIMGPDSTPADLSLIYTKLEDDLIQQIKMCARTREHFKALGDVASSNRFEQLILNSKKDLDAVRVGFKRGDKPPLFHYESRSFTMIQCNTDLNDSDCEVTILRGINFNVPNPKELDTYIKIEFPYPSDAPPQDRTEVVKDTNSPEYNHKIVFSVDRKVRALSRVFKRHFVKCQIVCKGSWFHRDTVLGSVKVPLVSLENKCTLHESFDLIDDRKKMVGGKLEVKIRLRNPLLNKQLEKVTERWIVIDKF